MSRPVSNCLVIKATKDESAYQRLLAIMRINIKHGAFSQYPCKCNPPCPLPTDEELEKMNARLTDDLQKPEPDEFFIAE